MRESDQAHINIPDVEFSVFLKIIQFLHTREIKFSSMNEAIELIIAADKFLLDDVKQVCEAYLSKSLKKDTIYMCWELAIEFNAKQLRSSCIKWILENLDSLWEHKEDAEVLYEFLASNNVQSLMFDFISEYFSNPQSSPDFALPTPITPPTPETPL
eukprot:TRINITY_DN5796_c0_g1_i2.p1 TRINITY_DN5796_c0_g1~~TRINITY_DN5796_c0_g1_i2.p1  ORF type:complete len:157 (+),score=25.09 TRINITY_DN5796_c0_g1_i2:164-634(+)